MLSGGIVAMECLSSGAADWTLVVHDLFLGESLWSLTGLPDAYVVSDRHLFTVDVTKVPPTGLADGYETYILNAHDIRTGSLIWSVPFEEWVERDRKLAESHTLFVQFGQATPDMPEHVVVSLNAASALQLSDGGELWHSTLLTGLYHGGGIAVEPDFSGGYIGRDVRTNNEVWTLRQRDTEAIDGLECHIPVIEFTSWCFDMRSGSKGYATFNMLTGEVVDSGEFPQTWTWSRGSPYGVLAQNGSNLEYFTLTNPNDPLWSIPSDGVDVVALTQEHILVQASAGITIIATEDGTLTPMPSSFTHPEDAVIDGLVQGYENTIAVLDLPQGR